MLCSSLVLAGQPEPPPDDQSAAGEPAPEVRIEDLPHQLQLGVRVESLRMQLPVIPTVVIVPDGASYADAVAAWRPEGRFPVLIDDGTPGAQQNIARFVRAFQPERVVTWETPNPPPADESEQLTRMVESLRATWPGGQAAADPALGLYVVTPLGWTPPGVVVSDPNDPAWPAALALAAGRGQPLILLACTGNVNGIMPRPQFASFDGAIKQALEKLSLPWTEMGDAIDAVTICANIPVRLRAGDNDWVALTDAVGRIEGTDPPARWAWCGQIFGSESESSYRAMCALFLTHDEAWIFDGYPDEPAFSDYDGAPAAQTLNERGLSVTYADSPKNGADMWRLEAARPITGEYVFVNTRGNRDFFDLMPGRCAPGDAPIMDKPTVVHFIHSWSAVAPANRDTVGGRWLERGAYAYVGSVQEPYLKAFVPPSSVASRIIGRAPYGAAVRHETSPVWKIAVLGDPLLTFGEPAPRTEATLPLEGAADLSSRMKEAVREREFTNGVLMLELLGRDSDAVRLAKGVLTQGGSDAAPEVVAAALMPAFRSAPTDEFLALYARAKPGTITPEQVDALWLASAPLLLSTQDASLLALLARNVRWPQLNNDLKLLMPAYRRVFGVDESLVLLQQLEEQAKTNAHTAAIQKARSQLR